MDKSANTLVRASNHSPTKNVMTLFLGSFIVFGCLTGLSSCQTIKRTKSRISAVKNKAPAGDAKAGKQAPPSDSDSSGPGAAAIKSNSIIDSDFVLSNTMTGLVLSAKAPPFADVTSGSILIPMCPTENASCLTPSIYVFNPDSRSITHIITASSPFIPYAVDPDSTVVGMAPEGTTNKLSYLATDLYTLLQTEVSQDPSLPSPADGNPLPILVTVNVTSTSVSASSGRPMTCKHTESVCYIPEVSGCGAQTAALRSFSPKATYLSYCKAYPASKRVLGFTPENEIIYSIASATENTITFEPLPPVVGNEETGGIAVAETKLSILGSTGSVDKFSFVDDGQSLVFVFSAIGDKNSWTVVRAREKIIAGNIPLEFPMTGRGSYFATYNGSIVEVRPSSAAKPPEIYILSSDKIYSQLTDNTMDNSINE